MRPTPTDADATVTVVTVPSPWKRRGKSKDTTSMEMTVRWKDGREEQACAIVPTIGLGIGDLVSKVMVRRDGHPEFYPLYMAEYVEIRSYGEIHRIRESQPVTVNMLQR